MKNITKSKSNMFEVLWNLYILGFHLFLSPQLLKLHLFLTSQESLTFIRHKLQRACTSLKEELWGNCLMHLLLRMPVIFPDRLEDGQHVKLPFFFALFHSSFFLYIHRLFLLYVSVHTPAHTPTRLCFLPGIGLHSHPLRSISLPGLSTLVAASRGNRVKTIFCESEHCYVSPICYSWALLS